LADPDRFDRLEDAALGGLGIPLIKRLTQSASYQRVGSGKTARNRVEAIIAA
jgi:anti-sigma regulatory factor (Ser/Thr protein kinase)